LDWVNSFGHVRDVVRRNGGFWIWGFSSIFGLFCIFILFIAEADSFGGLSPDSPPKYVHVLLCYVLLCHVILCYVTLC